MSTDSEMELEIRRLDCDPDPFDIGHTPITTGSFPGPIGPEWHRGYRAGLKKGYEKALFDAYKDWRELRNLVAKINEMTELTEL